MSEKKHGKMESKPVDWPSRQDNERVPLDVPTHDWDRRLQQQVDNPGVSNPIRGRKEREAYATSGGGSV